MTSSSIDGSMESILWPLASPFLPRKSIDSRHDSCDGLRRTALARRYHDQHLHKAVVGPGAAALDDKDILVAYRGLDGYAGLAIAVFLEVNIVR